MSSMKAVWRVRVVRLVSAVCISGMREAVGVRVMVHHERAGIDKSVRRKRAFHEGKLTGERLESDFLPRLLPLEGRTTAFGELGNVVLEELVLPHTTILHGR